MSRKVKVKTALLSEAYFDASDGQRHILLETFPPYEDRGEEFEVEVDVLRLAINRAGACNKWARIVNELTAEPDKIAIKSQLSDDLADRFDEIGREILSTPSGDGAIQILKYASTHESEFKRGFYLASTFEWELKKSGGGYALIPKTK